MGGDRDEDTWEEKEGSGDHCVPSVKLVDAYLPKVRPKVLELIASAGEVACIQRPTRQRQFGAVVGGLFYADISSHH